MPAFNEWTLQDAERAIADAIEETVGQTGFQANKAYAEDNDHWQNGDAWVGPLPGQKDSQIRTLVLEGVSRQFTPVDVIAEVLDRCANALMQKEPDIVLLPIEPAAENSDAEKKQKDEAEQLRAQISRWWDHVKLWELARAAMKRARWSCRGALRLWIPPGNLETSGDTRSLPQNLAFDDALFRIALDAPLPDAVVIVTDPDTLQRAAVAVFEELEDGKLEKRAELWYIDGEETVIRALADGDDDEQEELRVSMGARLPISEMVTDLLITEPVRRQQARLNFVESLLTRVAETGGFPERYILNAQPNGIWLKEPPAPGVGVLETRVFNNETWYLHQTPRTLGAAVTTDLRGVTLGETNGVKTIATPGVAWKDPTDPDFAIKSARHAKRSILEQCKQGHVALEGTAEASGTAYQQARADFEADLSGVKTPMEGMLREIIEAAIAWAESMSKEKPQILDRYRVVVNLKVTSGPITPTERQQNNADVVAGTLGRESAMASNGVEDVQAELDRMNNQPESVIALRDKQSVLIQRYRAEGMTWVRAAKLAGVTDADEIKLFQEQDTEDETKRKQQESEDEDIEEALRIEPVAVPA